MGSIRDSAGTQHPLKPRTRIGRAADNEVVVASGDVSGLHAYIEWRGGGCWELKDLSSRNGTFLGGERIESGVWHRLMSDTTIAFGDPARAWVVVELDRPQAEAICRETSEIRVSSDHILTINDDPKNWVDVVEDSPGSWVIEMRGRCDAVYDQQVIEIDGKHWCLTLPIAEPRTEPIAGRPPAATADVRLRFRVSADQEHVELFVDFQDIRWNSQRAYGHALFHLANARIRDRERGGHPDEHGWVYADDLCALAGYESESRLNVEIHRARREFARLGLPNAAVLIQRRRGTRQLRVGTPAIEVELLQPLS